MSEAIPVPIQVVQDVEEYIYKELSDKANYDNRTPLDESGIWSLHRLAARIYAMGFDAGERIESERSRRASMRQREAAKSVGQVTLDDAEATK